MVLYNSLHIYLLMSFDNHKIEVGSPTTALVADSMVTMQHKDSMVR